MENVFRGAFVFRSQDHQILTGTYFNNGLGEPYPETAKRIKPGEPLSDPFLGTFKTLWLEASDWYQTDMEITKSSNSPVYHVKWTKDGKPDHEGHAVLENGILFGYYWGCPK